MVPLIAAALLQVLSGCADARSSPDSPTVASKPPNAKGAQAALSAAPLPYYLDPAEGCDFLPVMMYPDAVALVKHYVALDNDAAFLESTPVTDSVYACPGHLPGPDEFAVVSRSVIEPLGPTDSVTRVVVRSDQIGTMTQDSAGLFFVPTRGVVADTFVLINTEFGWRIESPQLPNRVLGASVLARPERFPLRPDVREALLAAASRSGP